MSIGCIGAGSWGTTLAIYLARAGHDVSLYAHDPEQRKILANERVNTKYLPDIPFPETLQVAEGINDLSASPIFLIATPTQYIRSTVELFTSPSFQGRHFINTSKGIEQHSLLRVSEILVDTLKIEPDQVTTLSGPSHAEEVSRSDPAALVAGSLDPERARETQDLFNSERLRVYTTTDIIGVELGGALKNVIAICAGIVDGLEYGDNTKAALLTRGLAEITRLGVAAGAHPETFSGLSGLGDLIVTCTSRHSRNRYVGEQLGRGRKLPDIIDEMSMVAEGVWTTESAFELARRSGVEMPIIEQVHEILFDHKDPSEAIIELMNRSTKQEVW